MHVHAHTYTTDRYVIVCVCACTVIPVSIESFQVPYNLGRQNQPNTVSLVSEPCSEESFARLWFESQSGPSEANQRP